MKFQRQEWGYHTNHCWWASLSALPPLAPPLATLVYICDVRMKSSSEKFDGCVLNSKDTSN